MVRGDPRQGPEWVGVGCPWPVSTDTSPGNLGGFSFAARPCCAVQGYFDQAELSAGTAMRTVQVPLPLPYIVNVTVTSDDARLAVGRHEVRGGAIGTPWTLVIALRDNQVGAPCFTIQYFGGRYVRLRQQETTQENPNSTLSSAKKRKKKKAKTHERVGQSTQSSRVITM